MWEAMRTLCHERTAARLRALLAKPLEGTTRETIMHLLADNEGQRANARAAEIQSVRISRSPSAPTRADIASSAARPSGESEMLACFEDEVSALALLERIVWPDGRVCPRCGVRDRVGRLEGNSTRLGAFKCYACRRTFSITSGTVFSSSHVPLHKWMQAIYLLEGSNRPIRPGKLARLINVSFKTADRMQRKLQKYASSVGVRAIDRQEMANQ